MIRRILFIIIVITISSNSCFRKSTTELIKDSIGVDISSCTIIEDKDTHGGFLGDGEYILKADCSKDNSVLKQVESWNKLPLSDNLNLFMYGGKKGDIYYGYDAALKAGIPKIEEGYFLFIDRYENNENPHSDENLFNRYSHNFTLVMYDKNTNMFYYYTFDS